MPDHAQIGASAALVLVILRILEGLSVGASTRGRSSSSPSTRRPGAAGTSPCGRSCGCLVGFLLGSGIGALTSSALGPERMLAWGWRVPFLLGGVIAVWGIVFRRQMTESPALPRAAPRTGVARRRRRRRATGGRSCRLIGLMLMQSVGFYLMFIYAASYLTEQMHVSTARRPRHQYAEPPRHAGARGPVGEPVGPGRAQARAPRRLGGHVRAGLAPVVAHAPGRASRRSSRGKPGFAVLLDDWPTASPRRS